MIIVLWAPGGGGGGHSGSCGWWMSIPASRSSIYPLTPLCNLCNLLEGMVTDSSYTDFFSC